MPDNLVTFHVDCIGRNPAGTLFASPEHRVLVIRWEQFTVLDDILALAEKGLAEMAAFQMDTLIYDMRRVPEYEWQAGDFACRVLCAESPAVHYIAWLTANAAPSDFPAELQSIMDGREVQHCSGQSFKEVAEKLDILLENPSEALLSRPPHANFVASYGGSTYSIPELRTTVMRTAGNIADFEAAERIYKASIDLHKRSGALDFIGDSSAVPPIEGDRDIDRHVLAYQKFILPLTTNSRVRTFIHVRAGDPLWNADAPQPLPMFDTMGIAYYEVPLMEEAVKLLRVLQGKQEDLPAAVSSLSTAI